MKVGLAPYYESKTNEWIVAESARETFIEVLNFAAPEVPRQLLAILQESWGEPKFKTKYALQEWATAYSLTDGWCLDIAIRTLMAWKTRIQGSDSAGVDSYWSLLKKTPELQVGLQREVRQEILKRRPDAVAPQLAIDGWKFLLESGEDYKERTIEEIELQLDYYIEAIEKRLESNGWSRVPSKRRFDTHCLWLVRYQVLGWSHSEIAYAALKERQEELGDDAISKALRRTAKLLKLSLRPSSLGGRPRKTSRD